MIINRRIAAILGVAVTGLAVSAQADSILQNGSFESPVVVGQFDSSIPDSWDVLGASGNNSPIVSPSSIDHIGGYWQAADGVQSLDMNGLSYGVIGQSFATVIGQSYQVEFALSGNPDGGPLPKSLQVDLLNNPPTSPTARPFAPAVLGGDGAPVALSGVALANIDYENVFTFAGGNTATNMNWQTVSFTFVATSTDEYLQFTSRTVDYSGNSTYPNAFGPALDAVSVVPVPLPASAGVGFSMLGGFGLMFAFRNGISRRSRLA